MDSLCDKVPLLFSASTARLCKGILLRDSRAARLHFFVFWLLHGLFVARLFCRPILLLYVFPVAWLCCCNPMLRDSSAAQPRCCTAPVVCGSVSAQISCCTKCLHDSAAWVCCVTLPSSPNSAGVWPLNHSIAAQLCCCASTLVHAGALRCCTGPLSHISVWQLLCCMVPLLHSSAAVRLCSCTAPPVHGFAADQFSAV